MPEPATSTATPSAGSRRRRAPAVLAVLAVVAVFAFWRIALGLTVAVTTASDVADGDTSSIANLVSSPGADGAISLREAIIASNNTTGGPHTIGFNIAGCGGVCTIAPAAALPAITRAVVLDGWSQPGWTQAPIIELNGTSAGSSSTGLDFVAGSSGSTVRGLVINRFASDGIALQNSSNHVIEGNYLGVDSTGLINRGNGTSVNGDGLWLNNADNNTIGGTTPARRNILSANSPHGIALSNGSTGNLIEGNYVGVGSDGTTDLGNATYGVHLESSSTGNTVRGNVISGNGQEGIWIGTNNNTIEGNIIGLNAAGTTIVRNENNGIRISAASGNLIGGTTAAARNIISGNTNPAPNSDGIWIDGASSNTIRGNTIGTDISGTLARGNYYGGISIGNGSNNNVIGGANAGEGNLIAFNAYGVRVVGNATGNSISGNAIHSNTNLGIDLASDGVTANNGAKAASQPNLLMDFPVFTSAQLAGSSLVVAGYVGSAPNQSTFASSRVEVFIADITAAGNGEGRTYLGFLTTDASGNFSGTLAGVSGVTPGTTRITATATDTGNNTSEFGANFTTTAAAANISGTVFEDANYGGGAGRNRAAAVAAGGSARAGARVELFNAAGNFVSFTTTDGSGNYSFAGLAAGSYTVRAVNGSVSSARSGYTASLLPVQTFRTNAGSGTAADVVDHVGGEVPNKADAGNGSTTLAALATATTAAQSITTVAVNGVNVTGVDFGYSFNVVVNVNDSGQGSLRQAITNANTLGSDASLAVAGRTAGIEHVVFMIPNGTTGAGGSLGFAAGGLRASLNSFTTSAGSYNVATVAPTSTLPTVSSPLVIDAQTQPGWILNPIVELNGSGASGSGLTVIAGSSTIRGLVINRFASGDGISLTTAGGNVVQGVWSGTNAAGTAASANFYDGIWLQNSPNNQIGGTLASQRNVLSGNGDWGLNVDSSSTGNVIQGNYLGLNAAGTAAVANGDAGIRIESSAGSNAIGGTAAGAGNVISGNGDHGIALMSAGNTVQGNIIGLAADGDTIVANGNDGIGVFGNSNQIGGTSAPARNVISGNTAAANNSDGIWINGGSNNTIQGNIIGLNAAGTAARGNYNAGIAISSGTGNLIGGTAAGAGNVISGNNDNGIELASGGNAVQGNLIGLNAAGTAAFANTNHGIEVASGAGSTLIGGTAAGAGNVISGNGGLAISLSASNSTVQGNLVGLAADGTTALGNGLDGIAVYGSGNLIGGNTAAARNVIAAHTNAANFSDGIYVPGSGNTIQGNFIGTDITGTLNRGNYNGGVALWGSNNTVGGTGAGEGNLLAFNRYGAFVTGNVNGNRILGNAIHSNSILGIELIWSSGTPNGVTPNDGVKTAGQPNLLMDFPVFTSISLAGSNLTVAGFVGSAPNQSAFAGSRIEVFVADNDASGYGEGRTYLGFLTADASGNFSGTIAVPGGVTITSGSTRITATATDTSNNTSEFGANLTVGATTFSISGTVFEDVNYGGGNGRNRATAFAGGGSGRSGARVELYDNAGAFVSSATTDANGNYTFAAIAAGTYTVRAVNQTVNSARSGYASSLRAVQTFRTNASTGAAVDVYDHVGGENPALIDAGSNTTNATLASLTTGSNTPQSITTVTGASGSIANVDFGFSFNVVVNTRNAGQGSLRQLIANANALADTGLAISGRSAGIDHAIFMIANGTAAAGLRSTLNYFTTAAGSYNVATITPTSALPTISQPIAIDAQTQPGWTAAPIIELRGSSAGGGTNGLRISAGSSIVRGLVINRFGGTGILLDSAGGNTVAGNYIGINAAGTAASANSQFGVYINNVPSNTIGGTSSTQRNVLSGNSDDGLHISGASASGNVVQGNYIGINAAGNAVIGNSSEGMTVNGAVNTTIGGTAAGAGNVIGGSTWEGIWLINGATGTVIQGNFIGTDPTGTLDFGNNDSGVGIGNTGSASNNTVGGTVPGAGNVIAFNRRIGVAIDKSATGTAVGNAVLGNSIYSNTGLGIDIDDPYASPSSPGVTANDAGDADTGGNNRQNFPVLSSAGVSGSTITIAGTLNSTANTNFRIEFFSSPTGDSTGYGEAQTYLGFVNVTTDGSGNASFSATLTGVSVAVGHVVSATATDASNNTSEFAQNVTAAVGSGYAIAGTVFEDVNYGGGNGRNRAAAVTGGGSGRSGARVELYDSAGAFTSSATTDVSGAYSFTALAAGTYTVRVVNETVTSARSGYVPALRSVQTFRTDASSGAAADVYDFVGGQMPNLIDAGSNAINASLASLTAGTATAQSIAPVVLGAGNVTGVDFGFSFNVIVNVNDGGQGSLRQFITNANALANTGLAINGRAAGIDHAVFMISNGSIGPNGGLRAANNYFVGGAATLTPASALPAVSQPVILDAQTQPGWSATPIAVLDGNGLSTNGLVLAGNAGGSAIRGFVIRNFGGDGIVIQSGSTGNTIAGNYLGRLTIGGVDAGAGEQNTGSGIWINGDSNTIGGTTASQRNVISGNGGFGIGFFGGSNNTVTGNYVGLNAAGTVALGNADDGISIRFGSNNNTIGGVTAAARNVISGNAARAILIIDGVAGNVVAGNYVGTDASGTTAMGGGVFGAVVIANSTGNTIGGATGAHRNVIAGNAGPGVLLNGNSNLVASNFVGTQPNGTSSLPNGGHGIQIASGASNNTIGGTGAGNTIAFNTAAGIAITHASTGNALLGNSIHSNSGLGIDLAANGVTANDGATSAGQPNLLMDHPVFTSVSWDGAQLRVRGYVGSAAGQSTFGSSRVEIFLSDQDSTGYGEGRTYLGFATTDASGNFAAGLVPAAPVAVTDRVTGTATNASNNTSEFGPNFAVREYMPFRNGSFEDGNLGAKINGGDGFFWQLADGATSLDYWVVGGGLQAMASDYWNASHGVRSIELNVSGSGTIAQTFDTEPGTTYSVFFDYAGSAACGPTRKSVRVSAAGVSQDVTDYLIGGSAVIPPTTGNFGVYYDTALFRFTAVTDLTTLQFTSLSAGVCGPIIDNVRVTAADPFANGSFESAGVSPGGTYVTLPASDTNITAWTVGGDSIDYSASDPPPSQGTRAIALNGNNAGSVSQTFDATPGAYLRARFDFATSPAGPVSSTISAGAAGVAQNYALAAGGSWSWTPQSFVFLPQSEATTLSFASLTAGATGPAIDNVVIEDALPFINGSFEDVRFPLRDSTNLTADNKLVRGWVTSGAALQHWGAASFAPSLGSYSVHLNGPAGAGTIAQTFDVIAGQSYDVLFDAAANPALGADQSLRATIVDGGVTISTRNVTLNPANVLPGQTRWRTQQISFTATTSRVTLTFESQTPGNRGLVLDNVRFGVLGTLNTTGQFNAFEPATAANAITGVIKTKIVGQPFALDIAAIKLDKTGYSNFPMSGIKVELINATDNSAPLDELTNCRAGWTSIATVTTGFALAGSDNGRKALSFTVGNAYRNLRVKLSYPGSGTATVVGCSNDNFAVRPASFAGFAATDNDDSTAGTARLLNNAGAGGVVHRAGRPFTVIARAVDGGNNTVTSYDGTPQLAVVACVVPTGCAAGTLAGSATTTAGSVTGSAFTYSEAGSISVQLEDAVFADADAGDSSQDERAIRLAAPATIGRFIADRYRLTTATAPTLAHASCGAGPGAQTFTFVGQNFGFATAPVVRATPLNAAGTAINNARPAFGVSHVGSTFAAIGAPVALAGSAGVAGITAGSDALISFAAGGFSFARDANTPIASFAPTFTLTVNVADTSESGATGPINSETPLTIAGIGFAGGTGNTLHYGRLVLRPAYADLRSDLFLPLEVQRYTGLGWQALPDAGACVSAAASAFAYSQATGLLNGGAGASNCTSRVLNDVTTAGGRASIRLPKPAGGAVLSAMTVTLNTGAAAGTSCSGAGTAVPATSAGLPWLAGTAGAAPSARVSWGAPRSDYLTFREKFD